MIILQYSKDRSELETRFGFRRLVFNPNGRVDFYKNTVLVNLFNESTFQDKGTIIFKESA